MTAPTQGDKIEVKKIIKFGDQAVDHWHQATVGPVEASGDFHVTYTDDSFETLPAETEWRPATPFGEGAT